jgi:hypothetical protein
LETEEALARLKLAVLEFSDGFPIGEIVQQPLQQLTATHSRSQTAQEAS